MSTFTFTRQISVPEFRAFVRELRLRSNEFARATEDNVFALLAEVAETHRDLTSLDADILVTTDEFLPQRQRRELFRALSDDLNTLNDVADALTMF